MERLWLPWTCLCPRCPGFPKLSMACVAALKLLLSILEKNSRVIFLSLDEVVSLLDMEISQPQMFHQVGELVGGSQREERIDVLQSRYIVLSSLLVWS
jgi:hypothetical protein